MSYRDLDDAKRKQLREISGWVLVLVLVGLIFGGWRWLAIGFTVAMITALFKNS